METGQSLEVADRIIVAIMMKLKANRSLVERSAKWGRLVWRSRKGGGVEIDLELKL